MNKETEMVKNVYSGNVNYEWNRLTQDAFHRLEYDSTWRFLKQYLPAKGLVLDAGGGPGRYTIELARLGYDVVLLDLVAEHLEMARKEIAKAGVGERVRDIIEGSITDLSRFSSNSFDAVLCLGGPLSHVHPESERRKAVSELVRVAKKNAPVFASVIGKYGVLLRTPVGWPEAVSNKELFQRIIDIGEDYSWRGSGYCHYFTRSELQALFSRVQVDLWQMVGLQGLNISPETTNPFAEKYPEAWKNWLEIHSEMCTDPFVVDASGQIMIIVSKK